MRSRFIFALSEVLRKTSMGFYLSLSKTEFFFFFFCNGSPKKVLESITKCVFRIALVHSNVSFSVLDIERWVPAFVLRSL